MLKQKDNLQMGTTGIQDMHYTNPNFQMDDLMISFSSTSNPIL